MDAPRPAGNCPQWPYLHFRFSTFEKGAERYRQFAFDICCCALKAFVCYPDALAGSVVKIAARDVLASWKILISLGVAPLIYSLYACLATLIATRARAPLKWRILTPILVTVALPFMNYAALKFGEAGMDVLK